MPLFGKRESSPPTPPKSLGGMFRESLLGSGPKPEAKLQPELQPPGPFGKEGYKSYAQLRESARRSRFAPLPGTGQPIGKEKKVGMMKELETYGKRVGQAHGLSEQAFRERVLPQIKKDLSAIYRKTGSAESKEYKELARKMQVWERGFPK